LDAKVDASARSTLLYSAASLPDMTRITAPAGLISITAAGGAGAASVTIGTNAGDDPACGSLDSTDPSFRDSYKTSW
jgi:hypothetical protein